MRICEQAETCKMWYFAGAPIVSNKAILRKIFKNVRMFQARVYCKKTGVSGDPLLTPSHQPVRGKFRPTLDVNGKKGNLKNFSLK